MINFNESFLEINPEIAVKLLQVNTQNRSVRKNRVAFLASQMKAGSFMPNGEPIIISSDGTLLDGQHRLLAVIQSGVTIKSLIVYNVNPAAFSTIDTGSKRSAGDALGIHGYKNANNLAALAKKVWSMENNFAPSGGAGFFSSREMIDWIEEHPEVFEILAFANTKHKQFSLIDVSVYGTFLYFLSKLNKQAASGFFDLVASGENLAANNPVFLLRLKLINNASERKKLTLVDKYALITSAWNHWIFGKKVSRLILPEVIQHRPAFLYNKAWTPTLYSPSTT